MSCTCRKAIYLSRREAVNVAERAGNGQAKPYVCPGDVRLWHLTTKRKR